MTSADLRRSLFAARRKLNGRWRQRERNSARIKFRAKTPARANLRAVGS